MSVKLLPCPFCGGRPKHEWHAGPCWIECQSCWAVGPAGENTTTEQNEAAWNGRHGVTDAEFRAILAPFVRAVDRMGEDEELPFGLKREDFERARDAYEGQREG